MVLLMAKITISDLEVNQVITIALTEVGYYEQEPNDPEEIIEEEEQDRTNLIGLPASKAAS
jgi:uncharacterized protein YcgL (UPF0745 family)